MRVPLSWLREFVDVPDDVEAVARRLAECGFAVEEIDGEVIDVEIFANRPDCMSVYGIARETAAAFRLPRRPIAGAPDAAGSKRGAGGARLPVSIGDAGCGRYAVALADVNVAPSPDWLAKRLLAAGIRPINNIVDVTNYVMIELGHPMHAFDAARLAGPEIRVRRARPGEMLKTLDGQDRTLDETMLVIADRDRAVAIAGVMGGAASEVSAATGQIALESAWFLPASVRATSRRLGLKTEASIRFERGADQGAPARALARALALIEQIGAGRAVGPIVDVFPRPIERAPVAVDRARLTGLLGTEVPDGDVERILTALDFQVTRTATGWRAMVPSFRVDVARDADLVEDVGRHYGFDRVPATFPHLRTVPGASAPGVARGRMLRRLLCGAGLQEAVTFTFIDEGAAGAFAGAGGLVPIRNPLTEKFAIMRPSLLPGLIDSVVHNERRGTRDVRLFEVGTVFSPAGEGMRLGWVLTGARGAHWSGSGGAIDFSDVKGIAELLAAASGAVVDVSRADDLSWFVPGRSARLTCAGGPAGWIGQIAPGILQSRGLDAGDVYGGEIDIDLLAAAGTTGVRPIDPLPRHPAIVRDLSLIVDERLPAADVRGTIRAHAPATLVSVREFDRYQGKGVPEGQVSLSVRLTFRDPDRTLTDAEVQQNVDAIVAALAREHHAQLRGATGPPQE
jgi:phenylalanyl-tRNA synthetase beta chain